MRSVIAVLAALGVTCVGCGGPAATGAAPLNGNSGAPNLGAATHGPPTVVGSLPGVRERTRAVVRTQGDWDALLARLGLPPAAPPSAVDFTRVMLVVVASGEVPTGGYAIQVPDAGADAGVLHVRVVETEPGPGCVVTQALTYPSQVVSLSRTDGAVAFDEVRAVSVCR